MHHSLRHMFFMQITPAHDPNDFATGRRHKLEFINILTDDGRINSNGGKYWEGMKRFDARVAVEKSLAEKVSNRNSFYVSGYLTSDKMS